VRRGWQCGGWRRSGAAGGGGSGGGSGGGGGGSGGLGEREGLPEDVVVVRLLLMTGSGDGFSAFA
jgi:hypothetical protein